MGFHIQSGFLVHPPVGGSNVPGKVDANPFLNMDPKELEQLLLKEQDVETKKKMISALKQLRYLSPHRKAMSSRIISKFRSRRSEVVNPAVNLPYYQDSETDQGQEEIVDSLKGLYDNDNAEKFDYARQGIRPLVDIDISEGDFLTPKESPMGPAVKERGDGPDPDGLDYADPPTGGNNFDDVYKP